MSSKKYDDVSIFYDKPRNRYGARITLEKGKPRKTVHGKTEEEVLLKVRKLLYGAREETFLVSKGISLIELVKLNFERRDKAGRIGDAQFERTKYVIKYIEKSKIADVNIRDLTEKDYQDFFNEIAKEYADSSIGKYYSEINQALKYAKKKKMISENVLEDIIKPNSKLPKKEVKPLTIDQQKIFSNYLTNISIDDYKYKNVLLIQMYMGLRIGEALALSTDDIDLERKTLHVHKTLTEDRNGKTIIGDTPKTDAGNRVLPIPDIIYEYVAEQVEIGKNNFGKLLFTNKDKLVTHSSINSQLQRRLINLGIYEKGLSTHSLRHTYATRCIESGMPAIVLCKLMGHSDVRVTLNTYVKVFNEFQTKNSKVVEDYYNELSISSKNTSTKNSEKIIPFPKVFRDDYTSER